MTTAVPRVDTRDPVDVVVIGGGAGGLTAATHAARRGASVVLVTDGPLGGDCTHTGCVPSKTLLAAAAAGRRFDDAMPAVRAAVDRIAAAEDEAALARVGVRVERGRAELIAPGRDRVDGRERRAGHVIVATGATAARPPVPGLDTAGVLTNETVFSVAQRPDRFVVIGGGAIGCELAQAFVRLGSTVTLVEAADRLLPAEDADAAAVVAGALRADGVDVRTATRIERVTRGADGRTCLVLIGGHPVAADRVLVATGRRPVTDGLGVERLGIALDGVGRIVVDDTCATNVKGVWAVGDVTVFGGFTHVAGHMGYVAATNVTRRNRLGPAAKIDRRVVPRVTFTDPEVAHVGLTEAEAAAAGGRVAEVRLDRVDRAITDGRTTGFVKLVAGPRPVLRSLGGGRVLGATIVAPRAGELVAEVALAMRTGMFTGRLAQTIHAYPTWSMAIQQAASGFFFALDGVETRPARP
ncbi:MAG: dihydrolipoyl dehydrogenase family protein [Actinomycetota bacterium]